MAPCLFWCLAPRQARGSLSRAHPLIARPVCCADLLDLNGFLHIRGALDETALADARGAAERLTSLEELPEGIVLEVVADNDTEGAVGCHYDKAFGFDRALESLAFHPALWPIVLELTNGRPMLKDGVLIVDDNRVNQPRGAGLHCAREDWGAEAARFEVRDGRIFCDNIAVFFYLDDVRPAHLSRSHAHCSHPLPPTTQVLPGDGGLVVVRGSHSEDSNETSVTTLSSDADRCCPTESSFSRPADLFAPHNRESVAASRERLGLDQGWTTRRSNFPDDCALDGLVQLAPIAAGDILIMPEVSAAPLVGVFSHRHRAGSSDRCAAGADARGDAVGSARPRAPHAHAPLPAADPAAPQQPTDRACGHGEAGAGDPRAHQPGEYCAHEGGGQAAARDAVGRHGQALNTMHYAWVNNDTNEP